MRILKQNPLLRLFNSYLVDSPQPSNISYMWNFGSLLALCLGIQIVTGIFLVMHYQPNVDLAFNSVEHIMRQVNYGWLIRYTHANVASFFFIFVYAHIGRGLYYNSYRSPRVAPWSIGVIILVLMMATAFLGYLHSQKYFLNLIFFDDNYLITASIPIICSSRLKDILFKHNIKPVAVWEDLQKANKKMVYSELKSFAGIYLIINLVNGKMYVGRGTVGRIPMRFHKHLFSGKGSQLVWKAVKKYGLDNFAFLILEKINHFTSKDNQKLIDLENNYINLLKPEYNLAPKAKNT